MRVKIGGNKFVHIDKEDRDKIEGFRWSAIKSASAIDTFYAIGNRYKKCPTCGHAEGGRKIFYMHRVIMGASPKQKVDHINGNGLDNRKDNLRFCTQQQNLWAQRKTRGKSKYKGVHWHKAAGKWCAQLAITKEGKKQRIYLGLFENEREAAKAYDGAARKYFGEFAYTNLS